MRRWLGVTVLAVSAAAFAQAPATPWSQAHPDAFSSLAAWVQKNPDAARTAFWWDRKHPKRAETFLRWIVAQPSDSLESFESAHPDWPAMGEVLRPSQAAFEGFLAWGRSHPDALRELASRERAFSRVGFEQLAELWQKSPAAEPPAQP